MVRHIFLAQQRTASYKHTLLPCPFSQLDFQVVRMERHTVRNIYCGLSSLQASDKVFCFRKKIIFILVTWITAWTGNNKTDVREPDE